MSNKTFLAIIPARGGSKRLPNKNILNLASKPLITWSIEAGLNSKYINKLVIASDNDEILNISSSFGVKTIKRPDALSADTATSFDEIVHENKRMGTAGALSLIDKDKLAEPFFVINGDLLTNINFENIMKYHVENNSVATMGAREYDFQVPYGVVNVDGNNILSIQEKPIHRFFVSGGIYVLSPKTLDFIPEDEYYDMPTLFENLIENDLKSISFPIHEYWLDIGRVDEFERANREFGEVFECD